MRGLSLVAALLVGCGRPGDDAVQESTPLNHDRPGPLAVVAPPGPRPLNPLRDLSATCNPTDNALRFVCSVRVFPDQPVEFTLMEHDGTREDRVYTSDSESFDHDFGLYFLTPTTVYDFVVRAENPSIEPFFGTFATGDVPLGARASFAIDDGQSTAPMIGMVSPCSDGAFAVIVDPHSNEVLWYQDFATSPLGFIDGVTFTDEQTVIAIADGQLVEVDLMGNTLMRLVDLPNRVHHDVYRKDGLTYALFQENVSVGGNVLLLDGFYVFDASGVLIGQWRLIDHFVPVVEEALLFPQDYSHANAIWVNDDHDVLVSFRHLSAIAMIDGDLASPDFGTITWRLANPTSEFGTDFALTSAVGPPADFERQHNVHFLPDGSLVMLDNRVGYAELSRVLELSVDPTTERAEIERQFVLPRHCDFQGAAMLTPAGNILATCAPTRDGYEFDDQTGLVRWHGNATCFPGLGSYIPRFVPLDW